MSTESNNSNDAAISVVNLSKRYAIYAKPQDRLKQMVYPRVQRMVGSKPGSYFREIWALREATFQVSRGETVGIIGRNGSGKSTLLQLICGTLNPSGGDVRVNGRVAALLELGSGFNPEFTGRENVFLNGSVLGLSQQQIAERFDAITRFADIGEFIEQPVRTYSSGMMLRLAFAVVAHVDADVLIIDEALAVGDAVFTQKCMRFIREFQRKNTVLFVSHDMGSVLNLCQRAVWLHKGEVRAVADAKTVAEQYLFEVQQDVNRGAANFIPINPGKENSLKKPPKSHTPAYGVQATVTDNLIKATGWKTGVAEILTVRFENVIDPSALILEGGERIRVTLRARAHQDLYQPILGFIIRDRLGQDLFGENTLPLTDARPFDTVPAGSAFYATFDFDLPMLPNGQYAVMASVATGTLANHVQHHYLHDACILDVASSKVRWGLVGARFDEINLVLES
jgi:lipopolysaccharide transport system ATP-binding protein